MNEIFAKTSIDAIGLIAEIKKDGRFRGVHLMLQGKEERIGELL